MIYQDVAAKTAKKTASLRELVNDIDSNIATLRADIPHEDSRQKQAEMQAKIVKLQTQQREIWGKINNIERDAFLEALAEEYGVVGNPKFDKAFAIAYSMGHSSGNSEIESYFSELVELIK